MQKETSAWPQTLQGLRLSNLWVLVLLAVPLFAMREKSSTLHAVDTKGKTAQVFAVRLSPKTESVSASGRLFARSHSEEHLTTDRDDKMMSESFLENKDFWRLFQSSFKCLESCAICVMFVRKCFRCTKRHKREESSVSRDLVEAQKTPLFFWLSNPSVKAEMMLRLPEEEHRIICMNHTSARCVHCGVP